jgi:hypothetical protein
MSIENKPQPQLSILIPSIPSRYEKAMRLYNKILGMIGDMNIEVLLLMDNKVMTIGEKRDHLKNISSGKYFMLVDDDDDLLSVKEIYQGTFSDKDVITFQQRCQNSDKSSFIVTFRVGSEVEHKTNEAGMYLDINRPPFHVCAWHWKFKIFKFPYINYGEDWGFVEQANKIVKSEYYIHEVLYSYNFDPKASEASTTEQVEKGDLTSFNDAATDKELTEFASAVPLQSIAELESEKPADEKEYAIVNLITPGIPRYKTGQKRLWESMAKWKPRNVDVFYFHSEEEVGAPKHSDNPYAFKLYAIKKVREMGYKKVLWLDASVVAVKDFMSIFEWIEEKGLFFENSGWAAGQWSNQACLDYFNVTREDAMKMPMYSAGFSGFDFTNPLAVQFFDNWWRAMEAGAFKGSHTDHRHDMTCGGIIASKMNLISLYAECTQFFSYVGPGYTPNPDSPFQLLGL